MSIESTRRLRAWSVFPIASAVIALCVACSTPPGKSSRHSATTAPRVTAPGTKPHPTPPTVTIPARPHALVVPVPGSIDPNGRTDDTAVLQRFIDKTPNGTVVRFRHGGRYRIEGTLFVRNRRRLTFDGQGATLFATTRGGPDRGQWWIKRGSQIVFRNLVVRGANPHGGTSEGAYVRKLETQHGFRFEGVNGAELDHVQVTDVYGDFVYIGRDKRRVPSRNVWIHDSIFRRNGRQGIAVTAATNVVIERNHFDHTRRSTIDLEPNARSWHVASVFVLHNTVGKGRLLFVASHGQGSVNSVVISGNRLVGHSLTIDAISPGAQRRSNWVVTDNVSDTTVHQRPLRFFGIDGLVVRGNTQRISNKDPGVVLTDDCGAHVSGNEFGKGAAVSRHGATCRARLAIPTAGAILGRNGPPTSTTTIPTPASSTTPGSVRPPNTPGRGHGPGGGGSGGWGSGGWLWLAAGVVALAAILLFARSRRSGGRADD